MAEPISQIGGTVIDVSNLQSRGRSNPKQGGGGGGGVAKAVADTAAGVVAGNDQPGSALAVKTPLEKIMADAISGYMESAVDEDKVRDIVDGQVRAALAGLGKRITDAIASVDMSGGVLAAAEPGVGGVGVVEYVPVVPGNEPLFTEPSWYKVLRYAMKNEKGASLFVPRGCGKSTAIRQLAHEMGAKTVTMQCAANMQIDSLIGVWSAVNGSMRFIEGPLTTAVRHGAWLLAEESNAIHPGVWSVVNTLTDKTGEGLRLPTGEVVKQSEGFRLVLIYNDGYAGTRESNAALKDRLMPIYCGYLAEAAEVELLEKLTGADEAECMSVVNVASMIRAGSLRFDLSPRSLVRWVNLVKLEGMTWPQAYKCAIVDLAGQADTAGPQRTALEEICRNTVDQWANAKTANGKRGK